ncbi:MAG: hypothetical protein V2B19_13755 [Pseudomonadota bacterium]
MIPDIIRAMGYSAAAASTLQSGNEHAAPCTTSGQIKIENG